MYHTSSIGNFELVCLIVGCGLLWFVVYGLWFMVYGLWFVGSTLFNSTYKYHVSGIYPVGMVVDVTPPFS